LPPRKLCPLKAQRDRILSKPFLNSNWPDRRPKASIKMKSQNSPRKALKRDVGQQ
jgi:hypothetical protein